MSLISSGALLVMLLSTVPQWLFVAGGLKTYHIGGALLAGCVLANPRSYAVARFVLRANLALVASFGFFLLLAFALLGFNRFPFYSSLDLAKLLFLVVVALSICLAIATAADRQLRWVCLGVGVLLPSILLALVLVSCIGHGVTLAKLGALLVGQPLGFVRAILLELFSSSLVGVVGQGLEDALANLRHGIMNTILLGMFLMLSYPRAPAGGWLLPLLKLGAAGVAAGMVVISFSRSDTIELAAAGLLAAGLAARVRGIDPAMVVGACGAVLLAGAVALTDLGAALVFRFAEDTGSYDKREEAIVDSFAALDKGFWFGVAWRPELTGQISAHNMILNAGQGTGIFGMIAITFFVLAIMAGGAVLAWRAVRARSLDLAGADVRWVIALAIIAAVRAMTAGNGLAIAEWSALGAFMGFRARAALAAHAARVEPAPVLARARGRDALDGIAGRWTHRASRPAPAPREAPAPPAAERKIAARFGAAPSLLVARP